MSIEIYASKFLEGIEYLIALASIIGFLGLIIGFVMVLGDYKRSGIKLIIISFVIVGITGMFTGVRYYRIH